MTSSHRLDTILTLNVTDPVLMSLRGSNSDPLPTSRRLTRFSPQGFSPERLPASCCHSAPDFHVSSPAKSFFKKAAAALFGGRRDKVKYYETLSEYDINHRALVQSASTCRMLSHVAMKSIYTAER